MKINKVGGWVQLNENVAYENPWIKVTHEEVRRPNGSEGIYGVVHFKNKAVGIIPVDDEGNTWLVRQSRYALDCFTWEIPEGGAPEGETVLETAKRELQEEVGLCAKQWDELMTLHTSNSVTDEEGIIFIARELASVEQSFDETEDIEVAKVPLSDVLARVLNNEITDSLTVCGILKLSIVHPEFFRTD